MQTLLTIAALTTLAGTQLPATSNLTTETETIEVHQMQAPLLQVGDTIEDFTLPTQYAPNGESEVALSTLLKDGPVVVTFFRGSWCPYCRDELSDIQDNLEKFDKLNTKVIAISPEISEDGSAMAEKLDLGFFVAHDENNELARSLGLTFKLDAKTIKKYREYKIDVPESNGTMKWELPIPATYIIDQDSTVRFVFDDENYSKRVSAKKLLKIVEEIQSED